MASKNFFHRHADFSHTCACACSINRRFQQVSTFGCTFFDRDKRSLTGLGIARRLDAIQTLDLAGAHRIIVDIADIDRVFLVFAILINPDDYLIALVDHRLTTRCGFFDP